MKKSILFAAIVCIACHGHVCAQNKNVSDPVFNSDKEQEAWNKKHHPTTTPSAPARQTPSAPQKTYTPPPPAKQVNIGSQTTTDKKKK